ncbi:oligohyaluronate lyase, partial [Sporosarcina newyorkensis 2681]
KVFFTAKMQYKNLMEKSQLPCDWLFSMRGTLYLFSTYLAYNRTNLTEMTKNQHVYYKE